MGLGGSCFLLLAALIATSAVGEAAGVWLRDVRDDGSCSVGSRITSSARLQAAGWPAGAGAGGEAEIAGHSCPTPIGTIEATPGAAARKEKPDAEPPPLGPICAAGRCIPSVAAEAVGPESQGGGSAEILGHGIPVPGVGPIDLVSTTHTELGEGCFPTPVGPLCSVSFV